MTAIIDYLVSTGARTGPAGLVAPVGMTRQAAAVALRRLAESGRISTQPNGLGAVYWISPAQAVAEHRRRDLAESRTALPLGVAILSNPVRLAGRLIYLERLLSRDVFASDATLRAIAGDYRATLAAMQALDEENDEVHA